MINKDNFWCWMLPSMILINWCNLCMNLGYRWFKAIVYRFDIKVIIHNHTNEQSLPFRIKMLKNVIPQTLNHDKHGTFSLPSIKTLIHELIQVPNQAIKSYFSCFSFSTLTHYLSVSHGLSTLDDKQNDDGDLWEDKNIRKPHINPAWSLGNGEAL